MLVENIFSSFSVGNSINQLETYIWDKSEEAASDDKSRRLNCWFFKHIYIKAMNFWLTSF